jgi:hypothetical protein
MAAMETSDAQRNITRNVRILMAARDMFEQRQLADALGWPSAKMTKTLKGDRRWSVEDLYEVAGIFGITPGALLGSSAEVVAAAGPAVAAVGTTSGSTRGSVTGPYVARSSLSIGEFAHVTDLQAYRAHREQGVTRAGAPSQSMVSRVG